MTTNTKNTNTKFDFTFRTKFEKLLNDENRPIITAAFEKFCGMKPNYARDLLWRLTYWANVTIEDFYKAFHALDKEELDETTRERLKGTIDKAIERGLNVLGLNLEIIPIENISIFRNELRTQYEKLYPDFLKVAVPDGAHDAFTALLNKTDPIVANVVLWHCQNRMHVGEDHKKYILSLFQTDKESSYWKGIHQLRFSKEEAAYLKQFKQFHTQIHDLLKALYEDKEKKDNDSKNMPFAGLDSLLEDAGMELPFYFGEEEAPKESSQETTDEVQEEVPQEMADEAQEEVPQEIADEAQDETPAEEPVQPSSEFKPLTPEAILAHKDVFTSFMETNDWNILLQVGKLGFDLNEVMAMEEEVNIFLEAAKALSK